MTSVVGRRERCVMLAFALGATSAVSLAQSQNFASRVSAEAPTSRSEVAGLTTDAIIAKMLERNRLRDEELHRYSAMRIYEVRDAEGKLAAQEVVRIRYEAPDKKTFEKTSEQGSAIVRRLVFDRLLQSEGETSSGREHHDSAITDANYSFAPAGEENVGPYHCFVFEAMPRRKNKYLFEGRIWVDAKDFAIVKIAGHPAKKLSFWVNRVDFVRQYQRIDGFWVPYRDETLVEVRMYGDEIFTVDHQQYAINVAEAGNPD
jgi:hypothetical protein